MFSPSAVIKQKTLAAKRAGVKDIILPEDNRQNFQENLTPERLGFTPNTKELGIGGDFFANHDIHTHVPARPIP